MIHTIGKDHDGTWWVGLVEVGNDGAAPNVMLLFKKVGLSTALRVVNCLNGGNDIASSPGNLNFLKALELCAHG